MLPPASILERRFGILKKYVKPVIVDIEVTNCCNAHCMMCPRDRLIRNKGQMKEETFITLVERCQQYEDLEGMILSGFGEPLLDEQIFEFITYAKRRLSQPITLNTNGSLLDKETGERLYDAGLDNVHISFMGSDRDTYAKIMRGLDFDHSLKNIESFVNAFQGKINISIVSILSRVNNDRNRISEFWLKRGIRNVIFWESHNRGGYLNDDSVHARRKIFSPKVCEIILFINSITWEGQVISCCHDINGINVLGNIVTHSFDEIAEIKREQLRSNTWFPLCQDCDDLFRYNASTDLSVVDFFRSVLNQVSV